MAERMMEKKGSRALVWVNEKDTFPRLILVSKVCTTTSSDIAARCKQIVTHTYNQHTKLDY